MKFKLRGNVVNALQVTPSLCVAKSTFVDNAFFRPPFEFELITTIGHESHMIFLTRHDVELLREATKELLKK